MLRPAMIENVRRLLATGKHSWRTIARLSGVSRGTVAAVAHGTRRGRRPVRDELQEEAPGPVERCPECGAMGESPCRACRVRQWRRNDQRRRPVPSAGDPFASAPCRPAAGPRDGMPGESGLGLELAGDHRRRYEEIHARRMREEPL